MRGLGYAHLGWFFDAEKTTVRRFAPDLIADPTIARVDRLYPLWMLLSLAIPSAIGLSLDGPRGAYHGLVWAGLTRICVVQHVTWSINSIAHAFGTRSFDTPDESRNNRLLAVLALGEGLHNNHHAFPRAAIQSLADGEIDPSGLVLRALEGLGLVWDLRRATPDRSTRREHP
jgi:stearoyl-CoA desaturase (delta-9 desaturase)